MDPRIIGVIGLGFLNQVPTLLVSQVFRRAPHAPARAPRSDLEGGCWGFQGLGVRV